MKDEIAQPLDDRDFHKKVANDRMFLGMFAENIVAADCYARGYRVLRPMDGISKYDLVVDMDGIFVRLQVKILSTKGQVQIGNLKYDENRYDGRGVLRFVEPKYATGDFDVLCLVDRETRIVYYIPFEDIDWNKTNLTLDDEKRQRYSHF